MARLVGFIGNRPDLGARALHMEGRPFAVRKKTDVVPGWGVGFYQGGEILLKRRPLDDRPEVSLVEMTANLRADILIAHIRKATVGSLRTENTHPFRYRQWLFAHTGTVEAFTKLRTRMRESLPVFLQRDVQGETDSELLFHLFLSFLHDSGQLDRPSVDAASARTALLSSLALVDRLCAEEGAGPAAMNILLSNPEYLLAVHRGPLMAYRVFEGRQDLERLYGDAGLGRTRLPDLAGSRLTVVASDFEDDRPPPGWTAVNERAIVTFTRGDAPAVDPI
ncbi:class II glutamine amidotransferase [Chondromyces apiculatus]|uniref:Glutamine amidotransferases class-II n=1 Tax=Chondromyces apiculatus DSM 436 TaxID=1192034 RepID=A0A017TI59_9BACT|nr:class II glutamine amidotransferase [Chondromyces apiculatus]EYF08968.1 Glutamine amidotransferases class-II [Chondromyces apiculatus DSM 436]